MKSSKRWIKIGALLAASVMMLPLPAGALVAEKNEKKQEACLGIQTREMLRARSGLKEEDWSALMEKGARQGRQDPLTEEALKAAAPGAEILTQRGRVYMMTGLGEAFRVKDAREASLLAHRLLGILGAAEKTDLRLWSQVNVGDRWAYVFQQMQGGLTVVGSTLRIVTAADGGVDAVFSSLEEALPESAGFPEITGVQAEEKVREALAAEKKQAEVLAEYTVRAVIPTEEDEEGEEAEEEVLPDHLVWMVYTRNPDHDPEAGGEMPYLAHVVGADGEYLRSFGVRVPGDRSVRAGYSAAYAFDSFMEKREWTGEVTDGTGRTYELTVPVTRDKRTGVWYLADPERKIAVADYYALAFGEETVSLVSQTTNEYWDEDDLITYANMIRVWDDYAALGWIGPDGTGTPVALLRDLCYEDGTPMSNAAYAGLFQGWQCFAYGGGESLGHALDVIAHEYTHCVTGTLMNTNLYRDDMGAINEAMSDILGNLCEMRLEGDTSWLMGEDTGSAIRSMLDPHSFGQPEYVWDVYYAPNALTPVEGNDYGGVHANASILNRVAARLCQEEGMDLTKARELWLTVLLGMTPYTDYPQMASLLRWAVKASGNGEKAGAVERLIAESRMEMKDAPETLPEGQRMVSLTLPDTEAFRDPNWMLMAVQVDTKEIGQRLGGVADLVRSLFDAGVSVEEYGHKIDAVADRLNLDSLGAMLDGDMGPLAFMPLLEGILVQQESWQDERDGRIRMVTKDLPTLYMLYNFSGEQEEAVIGAAVLVGGVWQDVGNLAMDLVNLDPEALEKVPGLVGQMLAGTVKGLLPGTKGTQCAELPSDGLQEVTLMHMEDLIDEEALENWEDYADLPALEAPAEPEETSAFVPGIAR